MADGRYWVQAQHRIHLENNPIQCDCELSNLIEYVHKRRNSDLTLLTFDNFSCYDPDSHSKNRDPIRVLELNHTTYTCRVNISEYNLEGICGNQTGCDCRERTYDRTFIVDCSNRNLTKAPELRFDNPNIEFHFEIHLENNQLKEIPLLYFHGIKLIDLSNNLITQPNEEIINDNMYRVDIKVRH